MELVFLAVLFLLMIFALTSGFPVAFSLPGSAIITILLASGMGYMLEGDIGAYFAHDGPKQWLSAGVTNFRSLYWIVERDTLIAIPLFIFMGIMLQRSKIAEDLLISMASLFGPVPGGLGISVVFVGTLLAATTGIVGATVIAMGLISLPAMLRNNYSKSLACGTICASGTLGQIIPPSIVLIILADQLSSAADQANTMRKELYRTATGEFSMPSQFDVVSASAGDMFMGAFIPGLILVGLYMAYILIRALINPEVAPPVPFEGKRDSAFLKGVMLSLVPPLTLIFMVLGSIVAGIATVNQAGSIGAIGAMIMAGYRLHDGKKHAYTPAIIALASIAAILYLASNYNLNVKSTTTESDQIGIWMAVVAVLFLLYAIGWSAWRAYKCEDTLRGVMIDTVKTTSMVFIILIGAAMLTSAFRAFGGEEIVKNFLTTLPGGFWTQFIVVMLVMFVLGFFLDFIEIAVVVVPIVAPILLSNPEANITAVWFGVMVGLNIQTSFLTPPFGFALFYLRGVADKIVKTLDIYKGATAFIGLQLLGLAIAGLYPALVNYLPLRTHLTSDTSPPPVNPKLQACLENYAEISYAEGAEALQSSIALARNIDFDLLDSDTAKSLSDSIELVANSPALLSALLDAKAMVGDYIPDYKPMQGRVRSIEADIRKVQQTILLREDDVKRTQDQAEKAALNAKIETLKSEQTSLQDGIPTEWVSISGEFKARNDAMIKARRTYQNNVDAAITQLSDIQSILAGTEETAALAEPLQALAEPLQTGEIETTMAQIKELESSMSSIAGVSKIKTLLSKSRRALKKGEDQREKAIDLYQQAGALYEQNIAWRQAAQASVLPQLSTFKTSLDETVGIRSQKKLSIEQAKFVARCQAGHEDISVYF
ncbi:MAG: TRAP transporter large permease subunit [Proteobacteria bacterium]|nr:TRAP transporter large permease subunit [Pseudomonadota bacterium]